MRSSSCGLWQTGRNYRNARIRLIFSHQSREMMVTKYPQMQVNNSIYWDSDIRRHFPSFPYLRGTKILFPSHFRRVDPSSSQEHSPPTSALPRATRACKLRHMPQETISGRGLCYNKGSSLFIKPRHGEILRHIHPFKYLFKWEETTEENIHTGSLPRRSLYHFPLTPIGF